MPQLDIWEKQVNMHLHRQNIPSIQLLSNYLLNVNLISTKYQVLSGYLEYLPFKLKIYILPTFNKHSSSTVWTQ